MAVDAAPFVDHRHHFEIQRRFLMCLVSIIRGEAASHALPLTDGHLTIQTHSDDASRRTAALTQFECVFDSRTAGRTGADTKLSTSIWFHGPTDH